MSVLHAAWSGPLPCTAAGVLMYEVFGREILIVSYLGTGKGRDINVFTPEDWACKVRSAAPRLRTAAYRRLSARFLVWILGFCVLGANEMHCCQRPLHALSQRHHARSAVC